MLRGQRSLAARLGRLGMASMVAAGFVMAGSAVSAAPAEGNILSAGGVTAVKDSYIVVLRDNVVARSNVDAEVAKLAAEHGATVGATFRHALRGMELRVSEQAARRIAALPQVAYVEQNHTVSIQGTQSPTPSWGLDRIDQRALPLNNSFTYPNTGTGVKAYIIDTGIRTTHSDFGGRATWGTNTTGDGQNTDCNGHGTHVASTTGGTTYGVAKTVSLVAVKVLNCAGSGTFAGVIAGIDWVTADHAPGQLAVANMSLGGGLDTAVNNAVTNSIADGVSYAVAAGNSNGANACNFSPAATPNAITVGSTTNTDARSSFSNVGTCLDVFAPGSSITAAWITNDTSTNTISGTSMASPHVAGAAALVLSANPGYTPQQVRDSLYNSATNGVVTSPGTGSPNKLLFVENGTPANDFSLAVTPASGSVNPGGSLSATASTATTSGSAQTVTFSATGQPAGVSVGFSPPSVTSGGSSAVTISTTAGAAPGTYPITITGTGTSATKTATYTLTINGTGGSCTGTNGNDVAIPDNTTVSSTITISGCNRAPSATSTVAVTIYHTYKGDLVVDLIAPDGTVYNLHNRSGGSTDNIIQTFSRNLSGEVANGTWTLRVRDAATLDVGRIDTWTLSL
jgi:subtilisin family serine protease